MKDYREAWRSRSRIDEWLRPWGQGESARCDGMTKSVENERTRKVTIKPKLFDLAGRLLSVAVLPPFLDQPTNNLAPILFAEDFESDALDSQISVTQVDHSIRLPGLRPSPTSAAPKPLASKNGWGERNESMTTVCLVLSLSSRFRPFFSEESGSSPERTRAAGRTNGCCRQPIGGSLKERVNGH